MLFKKKISQEDFIKLTYQLGYNRYLFLKEQFENQFEFKDSLLFSITEILTAMLVKRIYYFKNVNLNFDIIDSVNKIVYEAYQDDNSKISYLQYYVYLKEELWNIIKNDNKDMIYNLSDYFINEITDGCNTDETPRKYILNLITDWHFETKKIINDFIIK